VQERESVEVWQALNGSDGDPTVFRIFNLEDNAPDASAWKG
jgi:hypothetical protein